MKPETFKQATELDGRIRNVSAAYEKAANANGAPGPGRYVIDMTGLPEADRLAIRQLVLDYLDAEERKAQAAFDAL